VATHGGTVGSAKCRAFLIAPVRLVHMPPLNDGCRYVCVLKNMIRYCYFGMDRAGLVQIQNKINYN
jgi:hypothetical protein